MLEDSLDIEELRFTISICEHLLPLPLLPHAVLPPSVLLLVCPLLTHDGIPHVLVLLLEVKHLVNTGGKPPITQWVHCGYIMVSGPKCPVLTHQVHFDHFCNVLFNSPCKSPVGIG